MITRVPKFDLRTTEEWISIRDTDLALSDSELRRFSGKLPYSPLFDDVRYGIASSHSNPLDRNYIGEQLST
jgi:hypothetical protein